MFYGQWCLRLGLFERHAPQAPCGRRPATFWQHCTHSGNLRISNILKYNNVNLSTKNVRYIDFFPIESNVFHLSGNPRVTILP